MWTSVVFSLHVAGLASLFSPLEAFLNHQPILQQDWGLHFHHLSSLESFWHRDRSLWGYNPFFAAGYPSNTIQDLSIKSFELAALGLSAIGLASIQGFKILTFLAMASVPWLMYSAARNLFFDRDDLKNGAAAVAALLGTASWWNSLPREMFFYGMVGFAPASYAGVLGATLLYRIARSPSLRGAAPCSWLLLALVLLPLHFLSVVIVLPAAVALLMSQDRLGRRRVLIAVIGAAVVSILANSPWLVPALRHRGDDVSSAIVRQIPLFTSTDPFTFLRDYLTPTAYWAFRTSAFEKGLRLMLLVLGSWGTWRLLRDDDRGAGTMLASAWTAQFCVAYLGGLIPFMRSWQPLRFKVPLDLFLALASSSLVAPALARRCPTGRSRLILAVAACGLSAFAMNLLATESRGTMRLRTELRPELAAIVEWIRRDTPSGGRVLFEESGDETGFVYDGVYLSSFIPHWTNRQLIGGPINLYNDRHHFAEFHSGKLCQKEIATLTDDAIRTYFRLYNIGGVVAFHPDSIRRLQSVPGLLTVERRIGPVHLMRANQPLSWFLRGEGTVDAGLNRLDLSDLKGEDVVLRYHWIEGLSSRPPARILPIELADDPIPFIRLIEPPAALTLRVGR